MRFVRRRAAAALPSVPEPVRRLFARDEGDPGIAAALRTETVGGGLLLAAAALAMAWANSPWRESYTALLDLSFGPASLELHLDLRHWLADGLLAVFFLVAGLELKQEFLLGELRDPAKAALPVVAACCGVALPAAFYLLLTAGDASARPGWAIPVATDIAFALAVLAVLGSHLPAAMRSFLLTLAIVDDLIAITIIAVAYTADLDLVALAAAALPLAAFTWLVRRRVLTPWLLVPLGLATWGLVHASGVHATVAGVLLGLALPVHRRDGEARAPADRVEHYLRPFSAGVAVPLFALSAAGVTLVGGGLGAAVRDEVFVAVVLALVAGKAFGVAGGTWLTARFTRARLDDGLAWSDVTALGLLSGVGFTVALLIGDLSFGAGTPRGEAVRFAVLCGSLLAAALASAVLLRRNAVHRRLEQAGATVPPPGGSTATP